MNQKLNQHYAMFELFDAMLLFKKQIAFLYQSNVSFVKDAIASRFYTGCCSIRHQLG